MYKEFYGFTTYPFSLTPDPQFLYLSKKHENCLHYVLYSLERGHGLIVLTGKIGTGKTLLLNLLVKSLNEKTHRAHIVNTKLEFIDILKHISQEFGLESTGKSKIELLTNLKNFLLICEKVNEKAVIIIDEAQDLAVDVLEELRLLTNFESHEKKLLQIILVGQPQFEYILKLPQLTQLAQRIGFNCQLFPMNYYETKGYIDKRLAVAGSMYPIFTSRAMKKIFAYSKGIPRVINLICDTALLLGSGDEKRKIGCTIIKQAMKELNLYIPEKSISHYTNQKRDENGPHVNGITSRRDTTPLGFSVLSHGADGMEQVEKGQSQRDSGRRYRLALVAGLTSLSLLGVGFVLQGSLTSGKLREYTANLVSRSRTVLLQSLGMREPPLLPHSSDMREPPLLPHSSGVRELPLLPHSSGVRELPNRVQWVQTTVSYQFLKGKPLTVSLPQLQRTPEALPVKVTLDVSNSTPMWLNFDSEKLALSGTAPPQETGKTYHLTFRARTADGLESLLHCVLTIR
jgi:type II secretory pathway predicted ATPase ExeA